jgi:hypothetical protein
MEKPDPVVVYTSQGPWGAEVVRAKLEAAGIHAMLRYEAIGRVLGLTVDGLGQVEVLVNPEDEALARELVEEEDSAADAEEGSEE